MSNLKLIVMKKLISFLLTIIIPFFTYSQGIFNLEGTLTRDIVFSPTAKLFSNSKVILSQTDVNASELKYYITTSGNTYEISKRDALSIKLDPPNCLNDVWAIASFNSDVYDNLANYGVQYDLRKELDEEANHYIGMLYEHNAFFNDEYLTDYLQTLLYKIHPITLADGRPGNLNILVLKSSSPNASCFPNGTIVINTGLLSLVESEAELISILAHEVAHFVLDHQIVNINEQAKRIKKAEFWSVIATLAAAATETYLATQSEYYVPTGDLTASVALLSTGIANEIIDRLGAKYDREQEQEADMVASQLLKFLNIDPSAFNSVLMRLYDYGIITGNYGMFLNTKNSTHPAIQERIQSAAGPVNPDKFYSIQYLQKISLVTSYSAINEFNSRHYNNCSELVDRNIKAEVATESDYIIKAMLTRIFSDTEASNNESLKLLRIAEGLDVTNMIYVYKQLGITYLRLSKYTEAIQSFEDYLNHLNSIENPAEYIIEEIDWTNTMIYKTKQFENV